MKLKWSITVVFILVTSLVYAETGSFLVLKNVYLYEDGSWQKDRLLMRKRKAFDVVDLKIDNKDTFSFLILVPDESHAINGSGYILETQDKLQKLGQKPVKVYSEVLALSSDMTVYVSVPSNHLSYSGIQKTSPDFPNIVWHAVNYKVNIPKKYWVAEWAGVYRPDKTAKWVNEIYAKIKESKLNEDLTRKILLGLVETGFTKEQVKMALGEPLKKQLTEIENQIAWIYSTRKIIFEKDMVHQVL